MKAIFRALTLAIAAISATACSKPDPEPTTIVSPIEVKALYRERIAIPPGAELIVSLNEHDKGVAAGTEKAQQKMAIDGKPMPFEVTFAAPEQGYDANKEFYIGARIELEGKTLFKANAIEYPVLTDKNKTSSVQVILRRINDEE